MRERQIHEPCPRVSEPASEDSLGRRKMLEYLARGGVLRILSSQALRSTFTSRCGSLNCCGCSCEKSSDLSSGARLPTWGWFYARQGTLRDSQFCAGPPAYINVLASGRLGVAFTVFNAATRQPQRSEHRDGVEVSSL